MVRYHCLFLVFDVPKAVWSHQRSHQSSPSAEIARFHVLNFIDAPSKKVLSGHCRVELCANCCLLLVGFLYCVLEIEHPIKIYKNHWYQPIHSTDLVGWRSLFWGEPGVESSNGVRGPRRAVYGCLCASCSSLSEIAMAMGKSQLSMGNDIMWETQCHKI